MKTQKFAFISGIPASGKSYLARKVAAEFNLKHIAIDGWREDMKNDPNLSKWVDFFWDKDEEFYWNTTSCDEQWENLRRQSETFWPEILKRIQKIIESEESAIFEGVNILPHLARQDLEFGGIVLLGESFEKIFERNKNDPRWGKTEDLQRKEAEAFFYCEGPKYKEEAIKYGYPVFSNIEEAENELIRILKIAN